MTIFPKKIVLATKPAKAGADHGADFLGMSPPSAQAMLQPFAHRGAA